MNLKFYFVYILYSLKDKKLYKGYTARTTEKRFIEHIQRKNISTSKRGALILIYYEAHLSEVDAKRREKYFKTTKGTAMLKYMLRNTINEISV